MRAGILVHLVEPFPADETNPIENYRTIRAELEQYSQELGQRPEILVMTKSELPGSEEIRDELQRETGRDIILVSAVTGQNLNVLINRIAELLSQRNVTKPARSR
jgi:GTP-binding protein